MRALQVSQQYPSEFYPALGVMVQNTLRALAPLLELELLSPRPFTLPVPGFPYGKLARLPTLRREHGFQVHRPHYAYLVPKRLFYPLAGPALAHALRRYSLQLEVPQLIHAHWSYPDGWGALALCDQYRQAGRRVPLVIHARGTLERVVARQSARFRRLVARPLTAADAVIANSDALRENCLELGVARERIQVIPNGVDLDLFSPGDKAASKRALGLDPGRLWLLYCGNLRLVKGVDLLASAILKLQAAGAPVSFVLVGAGELEARLRAQLAEGLAARSVIMTGALPQPSVARYMNAADLLVLPSRSEARSNVIVEALACQTPVAAANVGGIPEVMRPEHGALFRPGDADAIVAAIQGLVADPARLRELGAAGRKFVLEGDLTWHAHARRTADLYRALIGQGSGA
jgi:glycosyltransferase involved in cell wall biosynthesis